MMRRRPHPRRGFTLVELIVAGVITAFVLGSVSMSLSQLGRAKNSSKRRFDAYIRADAALTSIRKDIVSVLRSDDLFYTRLLITDDTMRMRDQVFDRDEILVFNTRLRPLHDIDFNGEGFEYETQYRIADDDLGPVLWVRHDAMPDEYPAGGGVASPSVEGILSLSFQAYDGSSWYDEWDSDSQGLPLAVQITVTSTGNRGPDDVYTAPRAVLRTIVSIDRVLSPKDLFKIPEDEETTPSGEADDTGNAGANGSDGGTITTGGGPGGPGRGPDGGGPGPGRGPGRGTGRGNGGSGRPMPPPPSGGGGGTGISQQHPGGHS